MYIKGGSRRAIKFWAKHLEDVKTNDRVELIEKRGLAADGLEEMLLEMQENAALTRCQNFMYIASFSPALGEVLTEEQWDRAYEIFEQERGIPEGQPRIIYEHEKEGRTHRHVVWDRIDQEKQKAFADSFNLKPCDAAEKRIEAELDLTRTPSYLNRDPEAEPLKRNPKSWETFRGMKSEIDPVAVKAQVTAIFKESENAAEFVEGLEATGYRLCIGDRRDFVILDQAGQVHSLARRLDGVKAKELKAFMEGYDRASSLPTVAQATEQYKQQAKAQRQPEDIFAGIGTPVTAAEVEQLRQQAKRDNEREAQQTLKAQQQPEDIFAGIGTPVTAAEVDRLRQQVKRDNEREAQQHEQREHGTAAPAEPARQQNTGQQKEITTKPLPQLYGTSAEIWRACYASDNPKALQDALNKKGIVLAMATKQEAERSHKDAAAAQEQGKYAPIFREGEIVAVDERAYVYRLTKEKTGIDRRDMQRYLRTLDTSKMQGIDDARKMMKDRAATKHRRAVRDGLHGTGKQDRRIGKVINRGIRQGLSIVAGGIEAFARGFESLLSPPVPLTRQQAAIVREENQRHANAAEKKAAAVQHWEEYTDQHEQLTAKREHEARQTQTIEDQSKRLQRDRGEGRER